jgi:hypothetical protein
LHLRLVLRYPLVLLGLRLTPAITLFPPATVYWSSCNLAMHLSTFTEFTKQTHYSSVTETYIIKKVVLGR